MGLIENVDFEKLSVKPALMKSCMNAIKTAVASSAGKGVGFDDVDLTLAPGWPGETTAEATIKSTHGVSLRSVQSTLRAAHVNQLVHKKISSLKNISSVAIGPISVDELSESAAVERTGKVVVAEKGASLTDISMGQAISAGALAVVLALLLLCIMHVHTYPLPEEEFYDEPQQ